MTGSRQNPSLVAYSTIPSGDASNRMTPTDTPEEVFRHEKARSMNERGSATAKVLDEAKAAFDKMMAEGQAARKSGRPRKNPIVPMLMAVVEIPEPVPEAAAPSTKAAPKPRKKKAAARKSAARPRKKTIPKRAASKRRAKRPAARRAAPKHASSKSRGKRGKRR
jgi:hypothetical protein